VVNILTPFGFRHVGYLEGFAPTYGVRRRKIALGNTNPIFHGDPVVALNTGYIQQAVSWASTGADIAAGAVPGLSGVFQGCEYFSVSQQRKVRSQYWPGSDAQFDPDCFIHEQPGALFLAAANGTPVTFAQIDLNCGWFIATGGSSAPTAGSGQGNTVNGLSGAMIDTAGTNGGTGGSGAPATGAALPLRIVKLYSEDVIQGAPNVGGTGFNGADNTTNFNWAVVTFNLSSFKRGVIGI
jgi:hypothetical protein